MVGIKSSLAVVKDGFENNVVVSSDSILRGHYTDSTDCLSDSVSTDSESGSEDSPAKFVGTRCN